MPETLQMLACKTTFSLIITWIRWVTFIICSAQCLLSTHVIESISDKHQASINASVCIKGYWPKSKVIVNTTSTLRKTLHRDLFPLLISWFSCHLGLCVSDFAEFLTSSLLAFYSLRYTLMSQSLFVEIYIERYDN